MRIHTIALLGLFLCTGCATTHTESGNTSTAMKEQHKSVPVSSIETSDLPNIKEVSEARSHFAIGEGSSGIEHNVNVKRALSTSLLKSGQSSLSEEALKKILSSRVVLPQKGHLAIMRFPETELSSPALFGSDFKHSEAYLKIQRSYIDTLTGKLESSDRIVAVTVLPSLLAPQDSGIPVLREAAVRLQADLLLAFRISSGIYDVSANENVKAFCTFEAVLMDIRTGLIPYTTVVIRDSEEYQVSGNSIRGIKIHAEKEAVFSALEFVTNEITEFLRSVP